MPKIEIPLNFTNPREEIHCSIIHIANDLNSGKKSILFHVKGKMVDDNGLIDGGRITSKKAISRDLSDESIISQAIDYEDAEGVVKSITIKEMMDVFESAFYKFYTEDTESIDS